MPAFAYTGRDAGGHLVRGVLEAEDAARARVRLREDGLFITSLQPQTRWRFGQWFHSRPGPDEIAGFTFHLAGLVGSGISMLRGLAVLREQTENRALRAAIADIESSIQTGQSLSAALSQHPELFSPLYIGIIRTGEVAGALDQALRRLTDYLDREVATQQKVRMMLVYPAFVITLAGVVVGLFLALVVPVFERVYAASGAALPLPTRVLVAVSRLVRHAWPLLLAGVAACGWAVGRAPVRAWIRRQGDRLVFGLPKLATMARTVQVTRFIRTFAALQASGIPVLSSLEVAAEVTVDPRMREAVTALGDGVSRGRRLSETMRATTLFPPMVHRMVAVGEETGQLDALLQRASELLERETDFAMKRLMALAEPLLTLVLGGVVALVLLALYLPIFGLPKVMMR
ncbi:MAG: type II secretion system F family protein [Armatimonadota bacterium]|nr:type II secretion system F family protein [Armatimonadota bacterium]